MELEKRRQLALGIFLGLIVVLAVGFYLWANFLNRGTIAFNGPVPFTVEVFEGDSFDCNASPCEITLKRGVQNLILRKEDYESMILEENVRLWRTVPVEVNFARQPKIEKLSAAVTLPSQIQYQIVLDEKMSMQKLVEVGDQSQKAIVYFPKSIKSPRIFSSKITALVVDREYAPAKVYKIDILSKKRSVVENASLSQIKDGKWSPDGKYFVFSFKDSAPLWLMNESGEIKDLALNIAADQVSWAQDNSLLFVTTQGYKKNGNYIEFVPGATQGELFSFGYYYPEIDKYSLIKSFSELSGQPQNLVVAGNGNEAYFSVGKDNFSVILR